MKKTVLVLFCLFLACTVSFAQSNKRIKSKKLSKSDAASMTPEQRLVHETNRKSKNGKKKVSAKQKMRIQKRQSRKAKHMSAPSL
jgi:hypothetical protein